MHLSIWLLICILINSHSESLRVTGVFDTGNFFEFIAKFGFQKTEIRTKEQGFIYGNVTSTSSSSIKSTLAVLDRGYFLEYYGNRTVFDKAKACELMFDKISKISYDPDCYDDGQEDFLRGVPCTKDQLCNEEDNPNNVIKNYQFTYRIQDYAQSR